MKQVTAFIHHVRSADVIDALRDAGYKNLSILDIKGSLKPLGERELAYSAEAGVVISEVQLSLVCEDNQVDEVTSIIRKTGKIGPDISGWVYVSPIEQALPIGGTEDH
ncbi:P-II family nitrogen regulator [Candidatus Thalassolituus haligoni]|jgi:nitrogen regulatory protein P-II 1|uniref:P-II family nitrogen regulator n=1 Tax=Candidatus Thalassolituus haligoni TaxID=3100113 RepID=UPI003518DEBB